MPRPTELLGEIAQWELAGELLEQFGAHVGEYLMEQVKAALDDRDHKRVDQWSEVADKIDQLAGLGVAVTLQ